MTDDAISILIWTGAAIATAILTAIGKYLAGRLHAGILAEVRDIVDKSMIEFEAHIDSLRETVERVSSDRSAGDRALHSRQDDQDRKITWLEANREETNRRLEKVEKSIEKMDGKIEGRLNHMEDRIMKAIEAKK